MWGWVCQILGRYLPVYIIYHWVCQILGRHLTVHTWDGVCHIVVVVVVDFSSLAMGLGECSTIDYPPALFFLKWARNSSQWLSELRRLWPSVPDKFRVSSFPDRFPHYA